MKAMFVGAALLAAAIPILAAQAEPIRGGEIVARSTGGEFRGYGTTQRGPLEDVIWRLRPDGRVSSISQLRRRYPQSNSQFEEFTDTGTWRVEGDRLCVAFDSAHRGFSGCYAVEGFGGDHVRLAGPVHLEGTLGR
jgi:hypothetical protein